MSSYTILSVKTISKAFGGIEAVKQVSFDLTQGEIMGIIGPNGSGKTTMLNLLNGFLKKDFGQVLFRGKDISRLLPYKTAELGVTRTFQVPRPFSTLPAYKNLIIPLSSSRVKKLASGKTIKKDSIALDLLEQVGFERKDRLSYKIASTLPLNYLKRLELARCLAIQPEIILCDELFSGLSISEAADLIPLISYLRSKGITLIMVEHRLSELFRVADRILVMHRGEIIARGVPETVLDDPVIREAYLGVEFK